MISAITIWIRLTDRQNEIIDTTTRTQRLNFFIDDDGVSQ